MAPKKKGNKKGNDDWESELGDNADTPSTAAQEISTISTQIDDEDSTLAGGGGGLIAALKKNKSKKQKKGKPVNEDYLEGEDPPQSADADENLINRVPEEATAEDFFAVQGVKDKDGKGKQVKSGDAPKDDGDGYGDEGGTLKSKKEKEKEKREREKQRKKEQVCRSPI